MPFPTDDSGHFLLELGRSNELGRPISVNLKVINTSAIPTTLRMLISNFPAADVLAPPKQSETSIYSRYIWLFHFLLLCVALNCCFRQREKCKCYC